MKVSVKYIDSIYIIFLSLFSDDRVSQYAMARGGSILNT